MRASTGPATTGSTTSGSASPTSPRRASYVRIGETAGFELRDDTPERVQFAPPEGAGSFSFVAGDAPTERFRMAFPGGTVAEID